MDAAFEYALQAPLCLNTSYPYYGPTTRCQDSTCTVALPKGAVKGYRDVPTDERSLMSAVSQQPVSVAVHGAWGDNNSFQFYRGGVLRSDCAAGRSPYGPRPDHGVLLVGYGVTVNGSKYWKVKNSYGVGWGMDGYALLERGKTVRGGECGILAENASYPVLAATGGWPRGVSSHAGEVETRRR
jgi:KDEL-tailed cysteine endopeptidase